LLAILFLVSTALSASPPLHQLLHEEGALNTHVCLACSLAKGQFSTTDVTVAAALLAVLLPAAPLLFYDTPLSGFEYRLSPSRAPPAV